MQTVIVAGGAGFIGSHLCKKLLETFKVICIDNFITGSRDNIEPLLQNSSFRFIEHDITKPYDEDINKEDIFGIYHLASPASPNKNSPRSYINYPIETLLVNSIGTYHLLGLAKKRGSRFLFASSSEVYGDPEITPQNEKYFGNVNPNGIRSVYDEGKRFGEAMVMTYVRKFELDGRIVRIFNTYGPQMQIDDGRVVSNFITQALRGAPITIYGDGSQTRSFCYVDDLVDGLIKYMQREGLKGEVINLGNPNESTVADVATLIKNKTGSESEIVYETLPEDDPKKRNPDITKAKELLDWEPKVSFEEGLEKTIAYFKSTAI
jgi:dTDP-glucose 4,6-dehydratase